jgi:hypothetical protein
MEELPFSAGLQIIFADDVTNGRRRRWAHNNKAVNVDALALLEEAINNAKV